MLIGSLDQSTTATKFSLFHPNGTPLTHSIHPHQQISLSPGHLQHSPQQIITNIHSCFQQVLTYLQTNNIDVTSIKTIGICNQRETVIAWDVETGKSLYNAIVWCDTRTAGIAEEFGKKRDDFKEKTGLIPSSYFSLFKILWMLENVEKIRERHKQGKVRFGNIDTWIVWNLTGGKQYITDASNASRTFLYNLKGYWDEEILELAGLTKECLPRVVDSFGDLAEITEGVLKGVKINCILGDQQASAYAHNLQKGDIKCSYGTGCFLIMNLGNEPKTFSNFLTTILYKSGSTIQYGLQISIQAGAGIINWLKKMSLLTQFTQLDSLPCSNGVLFYPTFGSILSPYWQNNMTGSFIGLGLHTSKENMLRAVLDSICFRVYDNVRWKELPEVKEFRVDGGMTKNRGMMQFQADLIGVGVKVCRLDTIWGVAKGAMRGMGKGEGEGKKVEEIESVVQVIVPGDKEQREKAQEMYKKWNEERWRSEKWVG